MTSITTRAGKGSPLTHNEVDANFTNLNNDKLDTAGIALGSAASPTLKFTGDPNTGIYSPGADQLAVATNGTGRLFVGSDGSVGVGASALATVPLLLNDTGNGLVLQNAASGNYAIGLLAGTGSQDAYIYQRANAPLIIGTNNTERLRINSSGNVGIGTSSPTSKLTVLDGAVTAGVANGLIGDVLIGNYSSDFGPYFKLSTNNTDSSNGGLSIFTSTSGSLTEKLRIDSSGNVGIGTSSPLGGLHLANATAGSAADFTISNPANLWSIRTGTTDNALLFVDTQFSAERVRIDSSGNVGIGTTSPTTLLDVNADTVRVRTARTPASASATGATGEICWDAGYIYVCTATNTWKRSAISTW